MRWPAPAAIARRLMLTADSMTPANIDAAQQLQVERRMLDLLVYGMRQVLLTSIVIGPALTTWLTLPHIGVARSVIPLLILLGFGVERVLLLRRMRRARALCDDTPRRWANALLWRWVLGSLVVLLWFHFAAASNDRVLLFEMIALLTILAAGGAALFSSWPPVMWAVVTPLLLGMALQLILLGSPGHIVGAVFCTVLWVVLVSANLRAARTLHSEALAHLRNQELVHQLQEKQAQLQAANDAKTRFFAAVNHDLRQPLQAMSLYLSTLQPRDSSRAQDVHTLARMDDCMQSLQQMLTLLLDYSSLDSGQLKVKHRDFALQPLFDRLASAHAPLARQQQLQLRVRPSQAWVRSDPLLLERCLSNLLANALRYTTRGGVLLAAQPRGSNIQVCVIDTGIGIPEAAQESIFEEFVQLHNPERNPEQGYGLGLAIVHRIAARLGHALHLRSHVGQGSSFMLDVPAVAPDSITAAAPTSQAAAPLRGRALVVDDHALMRDALAQQLTDWGLQVQVAATGQAASAILARTSFDVVLSDWRLPGSMDGVAVLQHAQVCQPELKLALLITGEDVHRLRGQKPPFQFLRKPLQPLRLRMLLTQYLGAGIVKTTTTPPAESAPPSAPH